MTLDEKRAQMAEKVREMAAGLGLQNVKVVFAGEKDTLEQIFTVSSESRSASLSVTRLDLEQFEDRLNLIDAKIKAQLYPLLD